jgi:hypothetical protein
MHTVPELKLKTEETVCSETLVCPWRTVRNESRGTVKRGNRLNPNGEPGGGYWSHQIKGEIGRRVAHTEMRKCVQNFNLETPRNLIQRWIKLAENESWPEIGVALNWLRKNTDNLYQDSQSQQALYLLVTEERYWTLFSMSMYTLHTICLMY